ncbi:MAG: AAA family ATPase [Planctomycetaceae bacterium]
MKKFNTVLVWLLLLGVVVFVMYVGNDDPQATVRFEDFLQYVDAGMVRSANIWNDEITFTLTDRTTLRALGRVDDDTYTALYEADVNVTSGEPATLPWTTIIFVGLLIFFVLLFFRMFVKGAGGAGNIMELRNSRHQLIAGENVGVTFDDVGGCEEAKAVLEDLIDFLDNPTPWTTAGARLPRGLLLEGPPGCGKTLLARAVAGETSAKFVLVSASEFVEMFVGVGAARVRDLFESAAKVAPAVIFIDELDAIGRRRGSGIGAGHDEREQTLNQILVCLDGFQPRDRVVVIAATNRSDVLDPALLRPGRFDRRVRVPALSESARVQVLNIHTQGKPLEPDVDLREVARQAEGFNGAQLENLANEAALAAIRRARIEQAGDAKLSQADLLGALQVTRQHESRFDQVDAVLIESATQLSEPTGTARVRLTLKDSEPVEGEIVWADAAFLKIHCFKEQGTLLIPKQQVLSVTTLAGTSAAAELSTDQWARHQPGLL